jgi:hypothetical protein
VGVAACGEGFADASGAEADADGVLFPDGVGELREPAVFLRDDELTRQDRSSS